MEESAQRRERLKAMRMEASQEAGATYNDGSVVSLSNPLIESTANYNENQVQSFAQNFNYYTDPMAAYSGNKQRTNVSPQISHDYSSTPTRSHTNETFPSPSQQPYINHSPHPRMQQPHRPYPNPNYTYTPNPPHGGHFPSPGPSPRFSHTPVHGSGRGYPGPSPGPRFSNTPVHGSGRGYPSPGPGSHFRNSPNHGSGQGGQWFGNSMNSGPSSGRGRGRWSGQGGGRGGAHVSAEDRPDLFYNKSMVEDPWKFLEPVIWKSHKKQWFPNSVGAKKPRVSESPRQQQSSCQPSLAEILAATFNEATNDEPNAE